MTSVRQYQAIASDFEPEEETTERKRKTREMEQFAKAQHDIIRSEYEAQIRLLEFALQKTKIELEQAATELARTKRLVDSSAAPMHEYDNARAKLEVARLEVERAETLLQAYERVEDALEQSKESSPPEESPSDSGSE